MGAPLTTGPHQLELVPLEDFRRSELGRPVFAVRIPGEPAPWSRGQPRPNPKPGGPPLSGGFAKTYRRWRTEAIAVLRQTWSLNPIVRPCWLAITAVFPRPAGWERPARRRFTMDGKTYPYPWPWTEGRNPYVGPVDVDNLTKAVYDTLQAQGQRKGDRPGHPVLLDDRLVEPFVVPLEDGSPGGVRWYAAVDEEPCVEVRIWSRV